MSERPRVAVVVFPGSHDDRDAALALELVGADPVLVWHTEQLPSVDAVVLPGGFSYGDYLRCGAIARFSPVMAAVARLRGRGRPRCSASATASRSSARQGCFPGCCGPIESLRFVSRDVVAPRRARGGALHVPLRGRPATRDPGQARRGVLRRARRRCWRARAGAADRAPLRAGREPERRASRRRGVVNARRQRDGPDATPGARRRRVSRLDRRRRCSSARSSTRPPNGRLPSPERVTGPASSRAAWQGTGAL